MRLPFPERLPLSKVLLFTFVLVLLQQVQGTTILFSAGTAAFIVLAAIAFNVCGGLTRPSGGFVFAYAGIAVIFGIVYKVFLGEPGQSNLQQPERTIEVYVASMAAMLMAALLNRRLRWKKSLLPRFTSDYAMRRAALGCLIMGAIPLFFQFVQTGPSAAGSFWSAFQQLNAFLALAVIFGTLSEIRLSGGRRSITFTVVAAMTLLGVQPLLNYSKEALFVPFAAWLVCAASQRYRVSLAQIAFFVLSFAWVTHYMVPFCQYGRDFVTANMPLRDRVKNSVTLLSNLGLVRKLYYQHAAEVYAGIDVPRYFTQPQGLAERIQMLTPDDSIIDITEGGAVFGLIPTIYSFENVIPHFIWRNKPVANFGTIYAHELGLLAEDDDTTGISFSPAGDAFHEAKWLGVLVLLPLLMLMVFFTNDSVCGDTRASPFALLVVLTFTHTAPEAGLLQCAPESTLSIAILFFLAFITTKAMPLLATLILGTRREQGELEFLAGRPQPGMSTARAADAVIE